MFSEAVPEAMPAARIEAWAYREPFVISRCTLVEQLLLYASLVRDGVRLQAEAEAAEDDRDVAEACAAETRRLGPAVLSGDRAAVAALPPGPVRNVLDCLMWDIEAKAAGRRAWDLAGIEGLDGQGTVVTAMTVVLGDPAAMARAAAPWRGAALMKVKLGGGAIDADIVRLEAVAAALPGTPLIVDPNGAWSLADLVRFAGVARRFDIALVEQPLAPGIDAALADVETGLPLCADESCTTRDSLPRLAGYQAINIKLDKTGGFTEALALVRAARARGLQVMTGCNGGTSLAIAPAFPIAWLSDFVDLDGPLHLVDDRAPAMRFDGLSLSAPEPGLWG